MILLEGSVKPKRGEEQSGGGSEEVRELPELGPAVPTPRATGPGCRQTGTDMRGHIHTDTQE